jgi:hypothetical protein
MILKLVHCFPGSFIQSLIVTLETLLNKHVMIQIRESGLEIQDRRVRNVRDFLEQL